MAAHPAGQVVVHAGFVRGVNGREAPDLGLHAERPLRVVVGLLAIARDRRVHRDDLSSSHRRVRGRLPGRDGASHQSEVTTLAGIPDDLDVHTE